MPWRSGALSAIGHTHILQHVRLAGVVLLAVFVSDALLATPALALGAGDLGYETSTACAYDPSGEGVVGVRYELSAPTTPRVNSAAATLVASEPQHSAPWSLTSSLSLRRAAKEGTTLYRAVGPNELADLQNLGRYRVPAGGAEGKYFFETPEQASNFARMMGDKPDTTTSVRVSPSQVARGDRINPAREGPGYFFPHTGRAIRASQDLQ